MANEEPNKQKQLDYYRKMCEAVARIYAPNTDPDMAGVDNEFECYFTDGPDPNLSLDELL